MLRQLALLFTALMLCLSCAPTDDDTPVDQVYTLRGIVQALPRAGQHEISIHHEAVPDFVNSEGEVVGMGAMTMPFHLAEKELADTLAPGDKISFELEVRWSGRHLVTVRKLTKLPQGIVLDFEKPPSMSEDTVIAPEGKGAANHVNGHQHP